MGHRLYGVTRRPLIRHLNSERLPLSLRPIRKVVDDAR